MRELKDRPRVTVKLLGTDGNVFSILGNVTKAMKDAGWEKDEISEYREKAISGDYNHVLSITMEYCDVE